jgi:hypothetical protein
MHPVHVRKQDQFIVRFQAPGDITGLAVFPEDIVPYRRKIVKRQFYVKERCHLGVEIFRGYQAFFKEPRQFGVEEERANLFRINVKKVR